MLLAKLILFALFAYYFYTQIQKLELKDFRTFRIHDYLSLILACLLVFLNWFLEWLKWKTVIKLQLVTVSSQQLIAPFFAGILSGFLTPNLIGNFIGRMYYFERKYRSGIVVFTLFSNASQFLASILFGVFGVILCGFPQDLAALNNLAGLIGLILGGLLLVFAYYRIEFLAQGFFRQKKWFKYLKFKLAENKQFRSKILIFSLLRHTVFSLQFYLIFQAFGLKPDFTYLFWIWQVYFWSTLLPSLFLGKLLIRESIALWIFSGLTTELELVLLSSVCLWLINQALPALIAIPFIRLRPTR